MPPDKEMDAKRLGNKNGKDFAAFGESMRKHNMFHQTVFVWWTIPSSPTHTSRYIVFCGRKFIVLEWRGGKSTM